MSINCCDVSPSYLSDCAGAALGCALVVAIHYL
jgi:hypothetical protein